MLSYNISIVQMFDLSRRIFFIRLCENVIKNGARLYSPAPFFYLLQSTLLSLTLPA